MENLTSNQPGGAPHKEPMRESRSVGQAVASRNQTRRRSLRIDGSVLPQALPRNVCELAFEKLNICMGVKPKFREYSALKKEADIAFEKADDDHNGWLDAEELISLAGGSEVCAALRGAARRAHSVRTRPPRPALTT
jgi:hypothetical protein